MSSSWATGSIGRDISARCPTSPCSSPTPRRPEAKTPGGHVISRRPSASVLVALLLAMGAATVDAASEGTLTVGVHVSLATRWLDPGETEGAIIPFMLLYALHDALVKPMPAGLNTPSLAESWTMSKDGLVYEFVLRKGARFHSGDPVTAEDVRYSFERYRGVAG